MSDPWARRPGGQGGCYRSMLPQLTELCREHDLSPDLVRDSRGLSELLARVLDECEARAEAASDDRGTVAPGGAESRQLHAVIRFAGRAAALQEKVVAEIERGQKNEQLRILNADLESAIAGETSAARRLVEMCDTLGVLSHKINNPLTSLMGRAQILQINPGTDPRVRKAAKVIHESAERVASYIRELARVVQIARDEIRQTGESPPAGDTRSREPDR